MELNFQIDAKTLGQHKGGMDKATRYGVNSVMVVVDGKIAECCKRGKPHLQMLDINSDGKCFASVDKPLRIAPQFF